MDLDDDQKNWNKENIPLNEDKVMCCQVSQNVVQEIRQEVTRQVLAELTIKNLDESDESDGREDNEQQQNLEIRESSFPSKRSDYFCNFQNNGASTNGTREEQIRIVNRHDCYADNTSSEESEKSFYFDEDLAFSEKMSPRSVQPKWKPLQRCRRPKSCSIDFSENKGRTTITESSDNEKRSCEGLEEFITPPLCTIPGIELEYKLEECDSETLSLSEKIILPKTSISSALSHEMRVQNEHLLG